MRLYRIIPALLVLLLATRPAGAFETKARAALVIDYDTGTVLFEKNADVSMPPASMSKLMTLDMVFEALDDGRLSLDEKLPVSKHAMSYSGSTMFLNTRDHVRVEDLIRGVIILSGNDACVVLAEALAGSEPEFAAAMTKRAHELGMTQSHFANANGWPNPGQRMSARDLVFLAKRIIQKFPQYYKYFSETEFAFDGRAPANRFNRNPLLKLGVGADGLKTGHTNEAGYGVVGSAVKNGRRVVMMISGLKTAADRASEAGKVINWAFRQFSKKQVLKAGQIMGRAAVWLGQKPEVDVVVKDDLSLLLPVSATKKLQASLLMVQPIAAPINKGQKLGQLKITIPDMHPVSVPVFAATNVGKTGFVGRLKMSARVLGNKILDLAK